MNQCRCCSNGKVLGVKSLDLLSRYGLLAGVYSIRNVLVEKSVKEMLNL